MHISRYLTDIIKETTKSFLLLGPRQTGKSTLIRSLRPELEINLADEETYIDFLRDPGLLKKRIAGHRRIFVDEVQRIPSLLNTAQTILDGDKQMRFYFTGSSARKLKRGQANLLPGRVLTFQLGPLSLTEIGAQADVDKLLSRGALPGIYTEEDEATAKKLLRSYAATYLREEVQAEALTRNLEGFSRFFDVIAARAGNSIDFTKLSSQAGIERMSAKRYFDVLVDTLILQPVEPFAKSGRRRLIQHPRFYFFDVGVLNGALSNFTTSADRKGLLFEHLCQQMIVSEAKSRDYDFRLSTYRTEGGSEVDFILELEGETFAIEVKATRTIGSHDVRGLKSFSEFRGKKTRLMVWYVGEHALEIDGVKILPLAQGIRAVFGK